jgi:hypothetical protein
MEQRDINQRLVKAAKGQGQRMIEMEKRIETLEVENKRIRGAILNMLELLRADDTTRDEIEATLYPQEEERASV